MNMKHFSLGMLVLLLWLVIGCGGGGGDAGGTTTTGGGTPRVTVSPATAAAIFGGTVNFNASVENLQNQTVRWTATGGTITSTGPRSAIFTAGNTAGTFSVRATSESNPGVFGTATVQVSQVGINLTPTEATLARSASINFTANVVGSTNNNVNFTASGGTIVKTGPNTARYTAPNQVGEFTVTASPVADPSKSVTARITVTGGGGANATVSGRAVQRNSTIGVSSLQIAFYNAAGVQVASTVTNGTGNFTAQVPTTAVSFHVIESSVGAGYYKQYDYNGKRYSALIANCRAALPTLSAGGAVSLVTSIELPLASGPPPPPPNGCGG